MHYIAKDVTGAIETHLKAGGGFFNFFFHLPKCDSGIRTGTAAIGIVPE